MGACTRITRRCKRRRHAVTGKRLTGENQRGARVCHPSNGVCIRRNAESAPQCRDWGSEMAVVVLTARTTQPRTSEGPLAEERRDNRAGPV
jgi:hypothetical protein